MVETSPEQPGGGVLVGIQVPVVELELVVVRLEVQRVLRGLLLWLPGSAQSRFMLCLTAP